ncbi:hypothetical protein KY389_01735 [Paracoccus bogoriensis]|uniref:hypothetical protein n=1 Tax=Paracoccus bogoriensis TaxID=242065 RepID=UPI001CA4B76A|nr:hypothetical protein [Paracoccus bogoriensis]MBW7055417.1 hypothetical protein [Paracoccus bogoriensis]
MTAGVDETDKRVDEAIKALRDGVQAEPLTPRGRALAEALARKLAAHTPQTDRETG